MSSSNPRPARKAPKGDYIETDSGNKISRRAAIAGTQNITLAGRTVLMNDVHLRGDLTRTKAVDLGASTSASATNPSTKSPTTTTTTAISIGKSTIISPSTTLRPPSRLSRGQWTPYPLKISDNVFIGPSCIISAAQIHPHVSIGSRCILQSFCIIRENVKILDDSVIPANMVVPPGVVVGGRPARILGEVGEGWGVGVGGEEWVEGGDLRGVVRGVR